VAKLKTDKRKAVDIKGAKKSLQDDRLADPLTEKVRQQWLVEEYDYQHTTELLVHKSLAVVDVISFPSQKMISWSMLSFLHKS
jgi:hypothetical protein